MESLKASLKSIFQTKTTQTPSFLSRKEKNIKVVVVGNCQARPLSSILEKLNPEIRVTGVAIVHLLKTEQYEEYKDIFSEADLIISQLVFDTYPCEFVRTNFLKTTYGDKVISIVNLFFKGYTPDWFYIRIPGAGPLRGPMGDYHNQTIFESWKNNLTTSEAAERLRSKKYNLKYLSEIEGSLQNLRDREELVDVPITDLIGELYQVKRLFFTFNHPSIELLGEYVKRILVRSGIDIMHELSTLDMKESLNQFIPLVNPAVNLTWITTEDKHVGVDYSIDNVNLVTIGKKRLYSTHEIVEHFYLIYSKLGKRLDLMNFPNKS